MPDVWVIAGAPLETGDGWRVWYSWPQGDFTPAPPRVTTAAGAVMELVDTAWAPQPAPKGSKRQMAIKELRLKGATPGALYDITFPERGRPLRWRTLPTELPLSLLIGSCFWLNDDKDGFYSAAVTELVQREQPAFKILMGDQLYADVWAPLPVKLREGLAEKYERYWGDGAYQDLLAACPTLVSCDDHEFWNDYPEPQLQVPYSWDRFGPDNSDALHELYDAYQAALNPGGKRHSRLDVGPVSFFIADTRSHRTRVDADRPALMLEPQWQELERWARELKGPGVLVLPQPLLKSGGSKTDKTLVDFKESDRLGAIFEHALEGKTGDGRPHDILILTGDIHTGRISSAEIVGAKGSIYELVASPASMVTPFLKPFGHEPERPPDKLMINRRTWQITGHRQLTPTVDNNVGLIRIAPGRNDRIRFSLQLWRVRPYVTVPGRMAFWKRRPGKGAQPLHDPLDLELR